MEFKKVAILCPKPDPASRNVKEKFLSLFPFKPTGEMFEGEEVYSYVEYKLYTPEKDPIVLEWIDKRIDADLFVFCTKHRSAVGTHSLSVHVPGNWGKADLGGQKGKICTCPASMIRKAYLELKKQNLEGFEVTLEATHHGPLIGKPCFFIEIGSDETMWTNEAAGEAIARTVMNILPKRNEHSKTVMILGGGHYSQLGNRILDDTEYAVGHICAKYALADLNPELLEQAITRTVEKVEMVILDWKGLGDQKEKIKELEKVSSVKFERSNKILHSEDFN